VLQRSEAAASRLISGIITIKAVVGALCVSEFTGRLLILLAGHVGEGEKGRT
jgi:hypothetical protein